MLQGRSLEARDTAPLTSQGPTRKKMAMRPAPESDVSPSAQRDAKMQCTSYNAVPVWCRSSETFLVNYRYSFGETNNVHQYHCETCSAVFLLLPTSIQARNWYGVMEVAWHRGAQRNWVVPGACRCQVTWVREQ